MPRPTVSSARPALERAGIAPTSQRPGTAASSDMPEPCSRDRRGARCSVAAKGVIAVRVALLATVTSSALVAAVPASPALGASYSVWACANASGAPLSVGSWVRATDAPLTEVQATCAEPSAPVGVLRATARATSGGRPGGGSWGLVAPPGTRLTSLDVWWSWQLLPAVARGAIRVYALGSIFLDPSGVPDPFDGQGRCCSDSAFASLRIGAFGIPALTDPGVGLAEHNRQSFTLRGLDGRGTALLALSAVCVSSCSTEEVVAGYQAYRVKTVVEDATPPTGTADGLRDGLRVGAGTPIDAAASDTGGGVRELTLRVDDQVVQRLPAGGDCVDADPANSDPLEYNVVKPCSDAFTGRLTLAAAQLPDAEPHTATVVATDAAGTDTVLATGRVARTAPPGFYDPATGFVNPDLNPAGPTIPNGSNASTGARVTLGFVRGKRTVNRHTISYTASARVRGRVMNGKTPVARARVWLASRPRGGQWRLLAKPLVTSRTGVVTAVLPARSPSRDVRLVYFPASDRNHANTSPSRALGVRTTTTIQTDQGGYRNGDTLRFTGRILQRRLIPHKTVYVQAIVRGIWRTFATTEADNRGRWRATHRFEATRRATRYSFRAVVPAQTGYAWATGHSRTVRVLVTP